MLKYIYSTSTSLPCSWKAHQAQWLLLSLSACHFSTNFSKQAPKTYPGLEVLHLLSCNLHMPLKIPKHTYSWLAQPECKYSLIHQRFHEHLLCDRHHSQHQTHGREQYTHTCSSGFYILAGEGRLARPKFISPSLYRVQCACIIHFRNPGTDRLLKHFAKRGSRFHVWTCLS